MRNALVKQEARQVVGNRAMLTRRIRGNVNLGGKIQNLYARSTGRAGRQVCRAWPDMFGI